jgi:hypothetical protein
MVVTQLRRSTMRNAQKFAVRKAAQRGWVIQQEGPRVFAVKGFGVVIHWEILESGGVVFDHASFGAAGGYKKFQCPEVNSVVR